MAKLVVALLLGTALALGLIAAKNRHRFRYRPAPLPAAGLQALAAKAGFVADDVPCEPGVVLRGLVRPPRSPEASWILLLPGNGADLLRGGSKLLSEIAGDDDFGLAVWAYRGFDGSGGEPSRAALEADSERALGRLADAHGVRAERLHLLSYSLGTALALRLAAVMTARGTPPASVVLLAPYERIDVTPDTWWAPWSLGDRYDALLHAPGSGAPVLAIHGAQDDAVPVGAARSLVAALGQRARLVELPGRGHADWLADPAVHADVRAFLRARRPP
jgi:pimeloyl-ACP methyl ester carboxylesterase